MDRAVTEEKILQILIAGLGYVDTEYSLLSEAAIATTAAEIENSCYDAAVHKAIEMNISLVDNMFSEIYSSVCYKIMINIDPNSSVNIANGQYSTYLIKKIYAYCSGDKDIICVQKIGYMTDIYLNPHINEKYIEDINVRKKQKITVTTNTIYTCRQCGANDTKCRNVQTRCLDEGSTLFITCQKCEHTWRTYG